VGVARGLPGQAGPALSLAARNAFSTAMDQTLRVGATVAVLASGLVWFVLPDRVAAAEMQPRLGGTEVDTDVDIAAAP
jgi:hypothetical protein